MIRPLLLKALQNLRDLGRPAEWQEFALIYSSGHCHNVIRNIKKRGLIKNDGSFKPYEEDEPFTGPRIQKYVLSEEGLRELAESERPTMRRTEPTEAESKELDAFLDSLHLTQQEENAVQLVSEFIGCAATHPTVLTILKIASDDPDRCAELGNAAIALLLKAFQTFAKHDRINPE